jgi:hypothetical protein
VCGESELASLTPVTSDWLKANGIEIPKSLINFHHVVGEKHDRELGVPLCLNCHAKAHEHLRKAGISMQPVLNRVAGIALMLDAMASFFEMLITALRKWAEVLRQSISTEDRNG